MDSITPPHIPRTFKEGTWVALGQGASAVAGVAGIRLLTEVLAPDDYGALCLLIGLAALAGNIFSGPIFQAVLRYYPLMARTNKIPVFRKAISSLLLYTNIPLLLLLSCVVVALKLFSKTNILALFLLILIILMEIFRTKETILLTAARRQKEYALWTMTEAWLRPMIAVALVLVLGSGVPAVLVGYLCATLIAFMFFHRIFPPEDGPNNPSDWEDGKSAISRQLLNYALPLLPLAGTAWITSLGDRYFIGAIDGLSNVGIYAAAYGIVSRPFLMSYAVIEQTLRPVYYEAVESKRRDKENRVLNYWMIMTLSACAFLSLLFLVFSKWVSVIFLAKSYRSSEALFFWLAVGHSMLISGYVYEKIAYAYKKTNYILFIHTTTALVSIPVIITAVTWKGIQGAAMATPIYFGCQLILSIYLGVKARSDVRQKQL